MLAQLTLAGIASASTTPNSPYRTLSEIAPTATTSIKEYADTIAAVYGLGNDFQATLACESGWNGSAVGDNGESFGVAQIHLPAHKDISKEEALDPYWAISWAASMFAQGKASLWTCWRHLGIVPDKETS